MSWLKNAVKGVVNVVTDAVKIGAQPLATAVNSIAGKEAIDINYSTNAFDKVATVNKKIDSAINVGVKTFADTVTLGYASKAVNLVRSDANDESKGNYYEMDVVGKKTSAFASTVGETYAQIATAPKTEKSVTSPFGESQGLIPLGNPITQSKPDMGVFQVLGAGISSVINNPKTGAIVGSLIQSVTKQATPSAPAAAAAATATVGNGNGIPNIQTQVLTGAAKAVFGNGGVTVSGSAGGGTAQNSSMQPWVKWVIGVAGGLFTIILLFALLFRRRR